MNDDDFRRILTYFDRPWSGYRRVRKGVKKRLSRHMEDEGVRDVDGYLALVARHPEARARCLQCLLVTVSRFCRDRRLWDHLRERVLPGLKTRYPLGLQAWSAGCAGGEEPYSLAMAWAESADGGGADASPISIIATDIHDECLIRARRGIYATASLKEVTGDRRRRFFQPLGSGGQWAIEPRLRGLVRFERRDLLADPPPGPFHLVLLRNNLLTYYQGEMVRAALERITRVMVPGALLILGSHERLPAAAAGFVRDQDFPWLNRLPG